MQPTSGEGTPARHVRLIVVIGGILVVIGYLLFGVGELALLSLQGSVVSLYWGGSYILVGIGLFAAFVGLGLKPASVPGLRRRINLTVLAGGILLLLGNLTGAASEFGMLTYAYPDPSAFWAASDLLIGAGFFFAFVGLAIPRWNARPV